MLVLSRQPRERIVIELPGGESITLTVCEIRGQKAWLGIDAPRHIGVFREELKCQPRESSPDDAR